MVIFSHRGIGFGKRENSLNALAVAVNKGFSVEVDLRLQGKNIILSHDAVNDADSTEGFGGLLKLIHNNPGIFFALHLKDNSREMFKMINKAVCGLDNCFSFVTDFDQDDFIKYMSNIAGGKNLALYVKDRNIDIHKADKAEYLWLDETGENIYEGLDYFIRLNKKIVCCSPELFSSGYEERLRKFRITVGKTYSIFGVCTDFPERFKII